MLTKAGETKSATEIAEEKEIISISVIQAKSENNQEALIENEFSKALNQNSKDGNKASILVSDIDSYTVKFESNRYYEVNKNGNISYIENVTGEKTLTIQCVNSKNEILGEYEYTIVTDQYSKLPPTINKYEPANKKIEGEIFENKTIRVLYYLICNDDTTLVFNGLDNDGNITTNENEIVSYMVGNRSNVQKNGLKENINDIETIVKIPENYKSKKVTNVGSYSFCYTNAIEVVIGDNVTNLGDYSFYNMNKLNKLTIGSSVISCGANATGYNANVKTITLKCNVWPNGMGFNGCNNFTELKIEGNEEVYQVVDNILYSSDGKTLKYCPLGRIGKLTIPEKINEDVFLENIESGAFRSSKLTEIIVPNCVKSINITAFDYSNITSITIGEGVSNIGIDAFRSNKLTEVIIDSATIAGLGSNNTYNFQGVMGQLLRNNPTLLINKKISNIGNFITDNYNIVESDKEGYDKYIRK